MDSAVTAQENVLTHWRQVDKVATRGASQQLMFSPVPSDNI